MGDTADISPRLVDGLYTDAMLLADEARAYFEQDMREDKPALTAAQRIDLSCESLKVTTRLMHAIAWLMNQKAYFAGDLSELQLRNHGRMLGRANPSDAFVVASFPPRARTIITASQDLYDRIVRLEHGLQSSFMFAPETGSDTAPVVHGMQRKLQDSFK